jgi:hypothetical protein
MAIGKKGQNIRLATELTGCELDMYNYEELPAFKAKLAEIRGGPVAVVEIPKEGEEGTTAVESKVEEVAAVVEEVKAEESTDSGATEAAA